MADHTLPHDPYIDAVALAIAERHIDVTDAFTTTPDGEQLDGVIKFADRDIDADTWPHGVYLAWDQHSGWLLIEQGGGRNTHPLDPTAVRAFSSPQQVAHSATRALRGRLSAGPITRDGTWTWDPRPLQAAVAAWEADES